MTAAGYHFGFSDFITFDLLWANRPSLRSLFNKKWPPLEWSKITMYRNRYIFPRTFPDQETRGPFFFSQIYRGRVSLLRCHILPPPVFDGGDFDGSSQHYRFSSRWMYAENSFMTNLNASLPTKHPHVMSEGKLSRGNVSLGRHLRIGKKMIDERFFLITRVVYRRAAPIQYISATERSEAAEPLTAPRLVRGPAGGAAGGKTFHAIWLHFPSKSGNNIDYRIVE